MQDRVILIRYGEIYLKGKNRGMFEKILQKNILFALRNINCKFERISGRYLVFDYAKKDEPKIIKILTKIPGLHSISPANSVETDENIIRDFVIEEMRDKIGSFKVDTNRADKTFKYNSMEYSKLLGGYILDSIPNLSVDIHNPDTTLFVDIRENGKTYIFTDIVMCCGGMPVSSGGNGLLLLSGGIDSPVAGFMMAKRGVKLSALHFESFPYTSRQAKEKTLELAKIISEYNGGITVYSCNVAKIQDAIHENCDPDYMITLVRRFMLRIAERLAKEKNLGCLITGESLAQVASQTMESITTISSAISGDLPFFRPLIGFDKSETIEISRKIGTYDISIRPFDDCCTVFLPKSPVTRPKLARVLREENRIDVNTLVDEAYNNIEIIKL